LSVLKLSQITQAGSAPASTDFVVGVGASGPTDLLYTLAQITSTILTPPLNISLGTITSNIQALNITGTWNAGGVTFDAPLFMNITNTASAAASLLMDLQVSSATQFSVDETGNVFSHAQFTTGNNNYNFQVADTANILNMSDGLAVFNGQLKVCGRKFNVGLSSDDSTHLSVAYDSNSPTTAVGFRVYNTTDAVGSAPTNYERGVFDWTTNANTLTIGTQSGGTGSNRGVTIIASGTAAISIIGSGAGMTLNGNINITNSSTFIYQNNANGGALGLGGPSGLLGGFLNWGGQARVTSDKTYTSTTVLADVTGLTVALYAGRTYSFDVYLSFTDAAAGGIQAAMVSDGTLTATAIEYDGWIIDSAANGIKGNAQSAVLGGVVASATTTGTAGVVQIKGTITVNVAGTIKVQAAQNTTNGTATTVKRGSYVIFQDMP
jgi:hypothetical protein